MASPRVLDPEAIGPVPALAPGTTWTGTDRAVGRASCWVVFVLSLAYVPAMLLGFAANGTLDDPVRDPYLAVMELLILLLAVPVVAVFASAYAVAAAERRTPALVAVLLATLAMGTTVCVHLVLLTVGRDADAATLPGYDALLGWTWPSAAYALEVAAWDLFLGVALLLVATVFTGPGPARVVRRGLALSGTLCLLGLVGAATGDMRVRDLGIVGYGVVLPVVLLLVSRLYAATPVAVDHR